MGTVLLPVFLIMALGFLYQGLRTGVYAILKAQGRLAAVTVLIGMSMCLAAAEIVLPFVLVASNRVSASGFALVVVFVVAAIAGMAGAFFGEQYRRMARPIHGLCSAAFSLAGGAFPVLWFLLAEWMSKWFKVSWTY